ncbi:putative membrane protein [Erwinia phage vB_EamM_Yoloswag]|uniref:Putative membrane protein n=1 Tax=Erwinia phage vB_EamM_Yoloswag TaxID=1958956 RepID=A0A1S6L312_9CAUD|nr:lipoprotein [Erwinia phage vB_EamM_Yoloswag]AQT28549.1 putative membrane protein [Erwinia phage vB_EamM_Yoloswag]
MRTIVVLMCLLLLTACSSNLEQRPAQTKATIQAIPQVTKLTWEARTVPAKPAVEIKEVDTERVAVLDKQGMIDLYNLYKSDKETVDERNKLIDVLNATIDERNKLLDVAKSEELRSNGLAQDLETERKNRIADQEQANRELWFTRIGAGVLLGVGLVF